MTTPPWPGKKTVHARTSLALLIAAGLAGCSTPRVKDDEPTLASLAGRSVAVEPDRGIAADPEKAIAVYRAFVEGAPKAPQRAEVLRRLGDLEMDRVEARVAEGRAEGTASDWRGAIRQYGDLLKQYPNQPGNDRVLYQLARAHEQGGELEQSLKVLDRLVAEHPQTAYREEAQFRRGELLFTARDYGRAEQAYTVVLQHPERTPYHERALYMKGWSQFKLGRLEDALASFFGVLDVKLAGHPDDIDLADLPALTRADRELVEDTFRVTSLALQNLQGAQSIAPFMDTAPRRSYEFRVYQQLAELYLKQERVKDAADTFGAFTRRDPLHAQAPLLQARVIEIYQANGFDTLALEAKKDYVQRYGVGSEYQRAHAEAWTTKAQPRVKTHLGELARHFHARAQKDKNGADVKEAVQWYRALLDAFPDDGDAPANRFLLAELLHDDGQLALAAVEFEKTAYGYPAHARNADAGYAALLAYAGLQKSADDAGRAALQRTSVDSAVRFAKAFPRDERTAPVLTDAAEKLFALRDSDRASELAQQVLDRDPPAAEAQRRVAWTVLAHTAFERGEFAQAERRYGELLALVPAQDAARADLVERQAAAIYKQGESARSAGRNADAAAHFARVAAVAPGSTVSAHAQYDAAALMLGDKDWAGAARQLEDFRRRFPQHPLQAEVAGKLAVAYTEQQQWGAAAGEFERLAAAATDAKVAREAQWHAAELHDKAGAKAAAAKAYERYVAAHPQPLAPALEARARLAAMARADGQAAKAMARAREIVQADAAGGSERNDRTRALAAVASLQLAEPTLEAYRKVALVEPLQRQLKLKKARMEDVLQAYSAVSQYGVAEAVTAATYHTASLYQDFGKSLMTSQRPKKLSKLEREQYDVMLEEQAYPFEEKAIELHETNARRAADGVYDAWVKNSFTALRELRPVRWGKSEKSEVTIDAIQ
jgi:outer membrane protein assembly factor BamD (BamD/ComL family)